ncbi:MAG: ABC transporter permease [Anaerolineales bacterium]
MTVKNPTAARSNPLLVIARVREVGISIFILILVIGVTIRAPGFLTANNFRDILMNISILVIVALAQTIVILTKNIDLSVGSAIGLTAMMVSFMVKQYPGFSPVAAILLGMALGSVMGLFNGLIIAYGKVPSIIATLGTLSIYRGMVFMYSGGTWINAFEMSASFKQISKGTPLGIPNLILFAIIVSVIVYYFLNYMRTGRNLYAIGSNPDAAQYAGIPKQRLIFMAFVLSGIACGLAGVLWASRFESAQTNTALGFELQTVAAAIVGGVSISGGVGTVPGVLLGALLLGIIQNALTLIRISPFWQLAVQGLLILVAVITDNLISRRIQQRNSQ